MYTAAANAALADAYPVILLYATAQWSNFVCYWFSECASADGLLTEIVGSGGGSTWIWKLTAARQDVGSGVGACCSYSCLSGRI